MRKAILVGATMLVALLPGAALPIDDPSTKPTPTVTIPPILPLPAEVPNKDNLRAHERMTASPEHYRCFDYPESAALRQADLIPTANVSARITFDSRTGRHEVITVDPRITISHRTHLNRVKLSPDKDWEYIPQDIYSWTYAKGTAHFAVVTHSGPESEKSHWRWLDPSWDMTPDENGVYEFPMSRRHHGSVLILATDESTCSHGNTLPGNLWKSLGFDAR